MNFSLSIFSSFTLALLIAQGQESGSPKQSLSNEINSRTLIRPESLVDDPEQNLFWRMTRNGWQQIEMPRAILSPVFQLARPSPPIHPFQVTVLISLAALAAMAWASDEWDWERLVEDNAASLPTDPPGD